MRAILDTAVLARAFTLPGADAELVYRKVLEGAAQLTTSRVQLAELGVALTHLGWEPHMVEEAITQLVRVAQIDESTTLGPGSRLGPRGSGSTS